MRCGRAGESTHPHGQDGFKARGTPPHPYTRGRLTSLPSPQDDGRQELSTIEGNVPSIYQLPPGCAFHNRCKHAQSICSREVPPTFQKDGRCVKCWMYSDQWEEEVQP